MEQTPQDIEERTARQQARVPYFGLGFRVATMDRDIYQAILDHFARHRHDFRGEITDHHMGTTNPRFVPSLFFADSGFNQSLGERLKRAHEDWSGMRLVEASCYGIRVYQNGCFLYNHVDTIETHIISASLCVDQRLNNPWPFYIEDIDGRPHEVSLQPGEMLFYESAKLKHGRPYPLDGDYYAAIFVHYTPEGYDPSTASRSPGIK